MHLFTMRNVWIATELMQVEIFPQIDVLTSDFDYVK